MANTVKSSSSTLTLSALLLKLPALGIAHSYHTIRPVRGPLVSGMMSSTALGLPNSVIRPSGIVLWNTSDSGVGGGGIAIAHTRGTGNSSYGGGVSGANVAPAAAVDQFKPRTDLAPVIIVVVASTASNESSVAFASCCSEVGAGGETGSGEDGSGDCVMDTSDSGAGGSASGITDIRDTGNSGYSGGVSGASVAPAAAVDHFTPKIDLNPVIDRSQSCHCCGYYPKCEFRCNCRLCCSK